MTTWGEVTEQLQAENDRLTEIYRREWAAMTPEERQRKRAELVVSPVEYDVWRDNRMQAIFGIVEQLSHGMGQGKAYAYVIEQLAAQAPKSKRGRPSAGIDYGPARLEWNAATGHGEKAKILRRWGKRLGQSSKAVEMRIRDLNEWWATPID